MIQWCVNLVCVVGPSIDRQQTYGPYDDLDSAIEAMNKYAELNATGWTRQTDCCMVVEYQEDEDGLPAGIMCLTVQPLAYIEIIDDLYEKFGPLKDRL